MVCSAPPYNIFHIFISDVLIMCIKNNDKVKDRLISTRSEREYTWDIGPLVVDILVVAAESLCSCWFLNRLSLVVARYDEYERRTAYASLMAGGSHC